MKKACIFTAMFKQGEEIADDIMQRLRFSRAQRETVLNLIHYHMVFMNVQKMRPGQTQKIFAHAGF